MVAIIGFLLVSCRGWGPVTYVDEGEVCFEGSGETTSVLVRAPACLSCLNRNLETSCTAVLDGDRITVTSDIGWEEGQPGPRTLCASVCAWVDAECEVTGDVAPGTYEVVHGARTSTVAIPETECSNDFWSIPAPVTN